MANHFDGPPALMGEEQAQLTALYRYLQTMSEQLNQALEGINRGEMQLKEEVTAETRRMLSSGSNSQGKEIKDTKTQLRSLIIKTAEIIQRDMDEISTRLEENMTAISQQFGTLEEKLSADIDATARGVNLNFDYIEELRAADAENTSYITHVNEYIFMGLLGKDASGLPTYGVAVGQGVTAYDNDGKPYINDNAKVATFTKDRLSFWHGKTEIAYFSDRNMVIYSAELMGRLKMGNYEWRIQADGSMGLTAST